MLYIVESARTVEQVAKALEEIVPRHRFGIMAMHNLRDTMAKKGVTFEPDCRVFEVCNPHQAKKVLEANLEISTALPCRISVYEEGGRTKLATIKPTAMLAMYANTDLMGVAREVEETIVAIMDEAAK